MTAAASPTREQLRLPGIIAASATSLRPDAYRQPAWLLRSPADVVAGGFAYADAPEIFLGRVGHGPLIVGLDTNVVIDIADHGVDLLDSSPSAVDDEYAEELEALSAILNMVAIRDIVFCLPPAQQDEFRHIEQAAKTKRLHVIRELLLVATCLSWDEGGAPGEFTNPTTIDLPFIRPRLDRKLTEDALVHGCHVLMTRDKDILKHASRLHTFGLCAMRPTQLLDELAMAGELQMPSSLAPDLERFVHVVMAMSGPGE